VIQFQFCNSLYTQNVLYVLSYFRLVALFYSLISDFENVFSNIQLISSDECLCQVWCIQIPAISTEISRRDNVLTTTQPSYLYNLISVQPHHSTRSSDIVTVSRPPSSSSSKVNNRSLRHTSPCLWNQLPKELRLYRSRRLIPLIWSHTHQFVISFITTVTFHYSFSLPLHTQNSSFPQILSSIVLLHLHPTDWLYGFFVFLWHVDFNFGSVC